MLTRVLAFAVVAVLLLTGLGATAASTGPAAGVPIPSGITASSPLADVPAAYQFLLAHVPGASAAQRAQLGRLSLGTIVARAQAAGQPLTLAQLIHTDFQAIPSGFVCPVNNYGGVNWCIVGGAALGGCLLGGILGSPLLGVGAGIGCAAGAVTTTLVSIFSQLFGGSGGSGACAPSVCQQLVNTVGEEVQNELVLLSGFANNSAALLPATKWFWYRLADIAAEQQIGSSTYNPFQDLYQSGIASQMNTLLATIEVGMSNAMAQGVLFSSGNGGSATCNGFTNNLCPVVTTGAAPGWYYLPHGADIQASTAGNYTVYPNGTAGTYPVGTDSYTGPSDPVFLNSGDVFAGLPLCPSTSCPGVGSSDVAGSTPIVSVGVGMEPPTAVVSGVTYSSTVAPTAGDGVTQLADALMGLQGGAALDGKLYWNLLRTSGYTDPTQIPAQFLIPYPWEVLPPNVQNVTNTTALESIYFAWLADMASYFNSTNYRGNVPCGGSIGCMSIPNTNTYVTGYIFTQNGNRTNYTTLSKWPYRNKAFYLWPSAFPDSIPVGTYTLVPQNDPLDAMVFGSAVTNRSVSPTAPAALTLNGDGGNVTPPDIVGGAGVHALANGSGPPSNPNDGAALYITSCLVNGQPTNPCVLSATTVNATYYNLSKCPNGPQSNCGGVFTFPAVPNFLGGLASYLNGLFGGGTLLWEIVLVIALALVFVLLIAIVYRVAIGSRRRGGGSSGSSQGPG